MRSSFLFFFQIYWTKIHYLIKVVPKKINGVIALKIVEILFLFGANFKFKYIFLQRLSSFFCFGQNIQKCFWRPIKICFARTIFLLFWIERFFLLSCMTRKLFLFIVTHGFIEPFCTQVNSLLCDFFFKHL